MGLITSGNFSILSDSMSVYQLMVDIYGGIDR